MLLADNVFCLKKILVYALYLNAEKKSISLKLIVLIEIGQVTWIEQIKQSCYFPRKALMF